MTDYVCAYEYQVNMPNGDINFITVYDLPEHLCYKFAKDKYPDAISIQLFASSTIQ